jgi:D-arabinose 5-phosphate isomerase GutQ
MQKPMPWNGRIPNWNEVNEEDLQFEFADGLAQYYHHGNDEAYVRRLRIWYKQFSITLLPTKGLSVLECSIDQTPLFWEPPVEAISSPYHVDLSKALLVNGKETEGTAWISQFMGGIEMLGLDNWGVNYRDSEGKLHVLHGNISYIPALDVVIKPISEKTLQISGILKVYDPIKVLPEPGQKPIWQVTKIIQLCSATNELIIDDQILNVSSKTALADWGYHIQLRPKDGCSFIVPSKHVEERFGSPVPFDYSVWKRAQNITERQERGYVHTKLKAEQGRVQGLLVYPDGSGIGLRFPHAPYTMVWNSCGGAQSKEFLSVSNPSVILIPKPWDGIGPEIGASDLDHGQRVEPNIKQRALAPGEAIRLTLSFKPLAPGEVQTWKQEIEGVGCINYSDEKISAVASHVWETAIHEIERLKTYCDRKAFISCVRLLANHQGRVFTCGVGTSAVAARKLAHSLCCVEIPANFLNPADAVHGGLGSVQKNDLVFLISKGGGTKEIVQLIPSLQAKRATIIGITEQSDSVLGRSSDILLTVAIEKEADTFNMLATTSTLTVIALFDALTIAAMQVSGFTKEQFAIIHPSGAVGDRLLHKQ